MEALRVPSPSRLFTRVTTRAVEIGGVTVPSGGLVLPVFHAGNVDPGQFSDPFEFCLGRDNIRSHLGFGLGSHFCVGSALVKTEVEIALNVLLDNFRAFELGPGPGPGLGHDADFISGGLLGLHLSVEH